MLHALFDVPNFPIFPPPFPNKCPFEPTYEVKNYFRELYSEVENEGYRLERSILFHFNRISECLLLMHSFIDTKYVLKKWTLNNKNTF